MSKIYVDSAAKVKTVLGLLKQGNHIGQHLRISGVNIGVRESLLRSSASRTAYSIGGKMCEGKCKYCGECKKKTIVCWFCGGTGRGCDLSPCIACDGTGLMPYRGSGREDEDEIYRGEAD